MYKSILIPEKGLLSTRGGKRGMSVATDLGENKRHQDFSPFVSKLSFLCNSLSSDSPADSSADCKLRPLCKKKKNKFNWLPLPIFVLTLPATVSHVTCFPIINVHFLERERIWCELSLWVVVVIFFQVCPFSRQEEHAVGKA